ncbi:MAG: sugar phosphate isomerase/epimerase [Gemmataceae bacterium]|nr:sugar phosphate isomerase/epimerase [Gemmataceae bacterium]
MKFSYLFYEPIPELSELDRRMQHLASLGYHGIELSAFHPLPYRVDEIAELSRKHQLPVVSLLSGWSYSAEGLCLSSPDAAVRARAVQRLIDYARQAARLGAVVVVGLMQGLRKDESDEGRAQESIAQCLKEVAAEAEKANITLVLEPVNHLQVGFNHTADEAAVLVQRVGSPALGYMLDTIHMNIEERSLLGCIGAHGPRIRHFHLCETNGGPFGSGNLDFRAVLDTLRDSGYQHFVSIKIYRKLGWEEGSRQAADFLRGSGADF